jgi:hypothetical protein
VASFIKVRAEKAGLVTLAVAMLAAVEEVVATLAGLQRRPLPAKASKCH